MHPIKFKNLSNISLKTIVLYTFAVILPFGFLILSLVLLLQYRSPQKVQTPKEQLQTS
ncbi:MAG: hypothetical protein H6627_02485 [Calditrichae bacterium]|nr:hypothetical protein [Calditrichota bacterium]MCB9057402.1 hypothetical protein [Calditrichia bacterium]